MTRLTILYELANWLWPATIRILPTCTRYFHPPPDSLCNICFEIFVCLITNRIKNWPLSASYWLAPGLSTPHKTDFKDICLFESVRLPGDLSPASPRPALPPPPRHPTLPVPLPVSGELTLHLFHIFVSVSAIFVISCHNLSKSRAFVWPTLIILI